MTLSYIKKAPSPAGEGWDEENKNLCFNPLILTFAAQAPYLSPHLTHRDVENAGNRMERLQPRHPWRSSLKGKGTCRFRLEPLV